MSPPAIDTEWLCTMVESRMSQLVTQLLKPSLEKVGEHETELKTLRVLVLQQAEQIGQLRNAHTKLIEAEATLRTFEGHLVKMEKNVSEMSAQVSEERETVERELASMKTEVYRVEEHLQGQQRCQHQAASELSNLHSQLQETREYFPDQLDKNRRQAHQAQCELEMKITKLELQHNTLTDELWGEELGLARLSGEMRKADAALEGFRGSLKELKAVTVRPDDLRKVAEDVKGRLTEVAGRMRELDQLVGESVCDVKEHLSTGLKAAGTHYAVFTEEVRREYSEELKKNRELRKVVEGVKAHVQERLAAANHAATNAEERGAMLASEMREALEVAERRRKSDRASMDIEFKGVKGRLAALSDNVEGMARSFESVSGVLGMILEAVRIQCALENQDHADREHLCLLGLREEAAAGAPSPPAQAPAQPLGSPGRSPRRFQPRGCPPVVSVDQRCLSCSGQARTVLSAFKIACLQYSPSPVNWEEKVHSRAELLQHLEKLLEKALASFGPLAELSDSCSPSPGPSSPRAGDGVGGPLPGLGALKQYGFLSLSTTKDGAMQRLPSVTKTASSALRASGEAAVLT